MLNFSFSNNLRPLYDTAVSVASVGETAASGDMMGAVIGMGTTIASGRATLTGNQASGALSSVLGAGSSIITAYNNLGKQIESMSASITTYNNAVTSGHQGSISAAALNVTSTVSTVVNTIGAVISGVAGAIAAAGAAGAAAAAPIASLGLGISAMAGLIAMTASNAVTDAVKSAAAEISHLLDSISSQSGNGSGSTAPGGGDSASNSNPASTDSKSPESGAGSSAMGRYPDSGRSYTSPLVLDLTGSGIDLTPLNTSAPYFDLANDGFARQTGWVGTGMGLLCLDPDDRDITNITQLFGNETTDGFDILRKLDANHDEVIDALDPAFANLHVWIDANGSAVSDVGELHTLGELGIASINLNAAAVTETIAGNKISSTSSYSLVDGTTHEIVDAWFANSTMNTRPVTPVDVTASAAALPQIAGAGRLRDLRSAMTLDQGLQDLVQAFMDQLATASPLAIESAAQAVLYRWAGVAELDPMSRGGSIDARQLGFVDAYLGRSFYSVGDGINPGIRAAAQLQQAWNDLYDAALARLVLQSPLAAALAPEFRYDASTDTVQACETFAPALAAAFRRLGEITAANFSSWDLLLRVADAARFDMGMSTSLFEKYVAAATNNTVASIANAIAAGLKIDIDSSGRIHETGSTIYHDFYAGPGISSLIGERAGGDPSTQLPGHDVFHYAAGDGMVEIRENDPNSSKPANTLRFGTGIDPSSIKAIVLANGDMVLTDGISGDRITLTGEFHDGGQGIQFVQFADGTTWNKYQLIQVAAICGTRGDDAFYGTGNAEVFDGKGGDDFVRGGGGNDTFLFDAGYGKLEISETDDSANAYNVLAFGPGISAASVFVRTNANSAIVLTDSISGDQVVLDLAMLFYNMGVQAVRFADNTVWTQQQLLRMATTGSSGNDIIYGTRNAEVFDGKGGNDYVQGGGGGDTFIFNAGYGKLEINQYDFDSAPRNVLHLGGGINASSVTARATSNAGLLLTDGISGDQVTIASFMQGNGWGVQELRFDDGTIWNRQKLLQMATTGTPGDDSIYGTSGADVFDGRGGNDYVQGGGGGDVFIFEAGYGNLEIAESDTSMAPHNVLRLGAGISASSVKVGRSGQSLVLTDHIAGDRVVLDSFMYGTSYGVQEVQFSDGTTWGRDRLIDMANHPGLHAERQVDNLIAGMASYGVQAGATSQITYAVQPQPQPQPQPMLSANLY
ncbi:calcium-binding protein [Paraburkholderia sp. BCC1886]|uniref:calcium-binding protein n=1 Tax=Paraburkholderia sp. BCC1886 TaxID=2562670 RepID=UPI00118251B9|nr:calcium-binding protein [Paraburkholderia sp. BCC1886]